MIFDYILLVFKTDFRLNGELYRVRWSQINQTARRVYWGKIGRGDGLVGM